MFWLSSLMFETKFGDNPFVFYAGILRGMFRILWNIYDETFYKNSLKS